MASKQLIKAIKFSKININDIIVDKKKLNKIVPIKYKNKSLICQTPFMEVRNELRKTIHENIYILDTLFKGDTKKRITAWYEFIENLENHIIEQVETVGLQWFTQKNVMIKSLIKQDEIDKNIYFIKWPINLQNNMFVDENKNTIDPFSIKNKDLVKFIIEISNLWVDDTKFGLAIIIQKVLVKRYTEKIESEYIFDDSESDNECIDDENNIISLLATEQKPKDIAPKQGSGAISLHIADNLVKNIKTDNDQQTERKIHRQNVYRGVDEKIDQKKNSDNVKNKILTNDNYLLSKNKNVKYVENYQKPIKHKLFTVEISDNENDLFDNIHQTDLGEDDLDFN